MIDRETYNKYKLNHYNKVRGKDGNFHIKKVDVDQAEKIRYLYKLLKEWLSEED